MVHLARLARFDNEPDLGAALAAYEVMVEPGRGEQRGDGRVLSVDVAVGEDEDSGAVLDHLVRAAEELVEGRFHAGGTGGGGHDHRQDGRAEAAAVECAQPRQIGVREERRGQADHAVAAVEPFAEEVPLGANERVDGGHDLLADRIEGRVRDLREELLEVVVKWLRALGEDGEGRVRPHRAERLLSLAGHRSEVVLGILDGVAEGDLALQQVGSLNWRRGLRRGQAIEAGEVCVEPAGVVVGAREPLLQLAVADDAALFEAHEEHAARLQASLHQDVVVLDGEDARLGGHDHEVVLRHEVAGGTKTVAVEDGADRAPIGEGDGGGAVPGLHEEAVVLVEGLLLGAHRLVPGPGFGDEHHHRVLDGAAPEGQQLERVVEGGRVAAGLVDDGQDLADVVEVGGVEERLARGHPVLVAPQGVDLAVVRDGAIGVSQLPAGEGVGAEAGVEHRQRRHHAAVAQVGVVLGELEGREHALVDDRAAGEAGEVEVLGAADAAPFDLALEQFADDEEAALEVVLALHPGAAPDEDLVDGRLGLERGLAKHGVVRGNFAPAEEMLPFAPHEFGQEVHGQLAGVFVAVAEEHAHAVVAARGQRDSELGALVVEELVGGLDEKAGAVAGVDLGAAGAAMVEVGERLDRLLHDHVGTVPLEVHEEANAAGVVLKAGVVKALLRGPGMRGHQASPLVRFTRCGAARCAAPCVGCVLPHLDSRGSRLPTHTRVNNKYSGIVARRSPPAVTPALTGGWRFLSLLATADRRGHTWTMPETPFWSQESLEEIVSARAKILGAGVWAAARPDDRPVISFAGGLPDVPSLPSEELLRATRTVLERERREALQYGGTFGPQPLREAIAKRSSVIEGIPLTPDNVIVSSGAAHGIGIACEALLDPGDTVLVESPTFPGSLRTIHSFGAQVEAIPMDEDGIRVDLVEEALLRLADEGRRAKLLYLIPTHQNPAGSTLPLARRERLLELAREHRFLLMEDDAYGELWFGDTPPPPSLFSLSGGELAIKVATFSKIIATGATAGVEPGAAPADQPHGRASLRHGLEPVSGAHRRGDDPERRPRPARGAAARHLPAQARPSVRRHRRALRRLCQLQAAGRRLLRVGRAEAGALGDRGAARGQREGRDHRGRASLLRGRQRDAAPAARLQLHPHGGDRGGRPPPGRGPARGGGEFGGQVTRPPSVVLARERGSA